MTNLDKMKQNIISQITLMDAETFLDFINVLQGQYVEDKIVDFQKYLGAKNVNSYLDNAQMKPQINFA